MQSGSWIVDFGSGEGEASGGVGEGGRSGEAFGVGDGLLEEFFGLGRAMEVEEGFGASVEESGIGVVPLGGDEGGVEGVRMVGVIGFEVNASQKTGDGGVIGVPGVEGFEQYGCEGDFVGISGGEVGLSELGGKGGIAGVLVESWFKEGFGVSGAAVGEEDMGEGGGGSGVVGGGGESEIAAVGLLGGGDVVGGGGYLGGG